MMPEVELSSNLNPGSLVEAFRVRLRTMTTAERIHVEQQGVPADIVRVNRPGNRGGSNS